MRKSLLFCGLLLTTPSWAANPLADTAADFHTAVATVAPIVGVIIVDPKDKNTWIIQFAPAATAKQQADAATVKQNFTPAK